MKPLPKAILLDMDDTILASGSADECWQGVCNSFASHLGERKPEELFAAIREYRDWYYGDPDRHRTGRLDLNASRRQIVAEALQVLDIDAVSLADEIAGAYSVQREEAVKPFPGAIDTLRVLKSRGVQMALITNGKSEMQRAKIEKYGLASFFDCILVEGELGFGKPDEKVYLHALDMLKVAPAQVWMVGDNLKWDVVAPQRLGIFSIWLDFAGTGLPEGSSVRPNRIITSLSELLLTELTQTTNGSRPKSVV